MISLREDSGFSVGVMPAAASKGSVSSKMRPLDRASVMPELLILESSSSGRFNYSPFALIVSLSNDRRACLQGSYYWAHGLRQAQPERAWGCQFSAPA